MVWLSGVSTSYEKAEETLARIGRIGVSDSSVWRQAQKWGEKLAAMEEVEMSLAEAVALPKPLQTVPETGCKGVAMDGAMICLREEGWKELKIGCVFDIEVRPTKDKETGKWLSQAHATHNQYTSHLGGPEAIGQKVWALAHRHGWLGTQQTIALGDGAIWIWHQFDHRFVNSEQLVDWYHATNHLHTAASLLHSQQAARDAWYDQQKTELFIGQAHQIAEDLIVAAIDKPWCVVEDILTEALYLDNNQHRMHYQALQAAGFPIGSGMVESGCKQFKARFAGPGMRWSRRGAEHLLPIRAAVMSHAFDSVWTKAHLPQN